MGGLNVMDVRKVASIVRESNVSTANTKRNFILSFAFRFQSVLCHPGIIHVRGACLYDQNSGVHLIRGHQD